MVGSVGGIYRQLKGSLNRRVDRQIIRVDERLRSLEGMPPTAWSNSYRHVLSQAANVGWVIQHSPRVDAWRWPGCNWSVVYAGSNYHMAALRHILCPRAEPPSLLDRVPVWRLPAKANEWASNAELVIFEFSYRQPWRSWAAYSFAMAPWVRTVLDVGRSAEAIIGSMRTSMRKRLRRVLESGFACRYSHDQADFALFYHSMFLPFVESRFQEHGLTAHYDDLLAEFQRGGLIMVQRDGQPVGGVMSLQTDNTFYSAWVGVLNGDYRLIRDGIQLAIMWFSIKLAQQMGCRYYDLGRALASMRNGTLRFKLGWGVQIRSDHRLHENWIFLSTGLAADLRRHLNRQQFLTEIDDKHYIVFLSDPQDPRDPAQINERLNLTQRYGLGGVVVVKRGCYVKVPT